MNLTVHQSIMIHQLKVGDVTSASVFQIGAAGSIKSLASLSDTGNFSSGTGLPPPIVVPLESGTSGGGGGAASRTEPLNEAEYEVPLPEPH